MMCDSQVVRGGRVFLGLPVQEKTLASGLFKPACQHRQQIMTTLHSKALGQLC